MNVLNLIVCYGYGMISVLVVIIYVLWLIKYDNKCGDVLMKNMFLRGLCIIKFIWVI